MSATVQKRTWQHIRHDPGSRVVIQDKDGDAFVLPVEAAIRACRSADKLSAFSEQFCELRERLAAWLTERSEMVDRAYLTLEADGVAFAVVQKSKSFDPDFEDALSALDLEIAQNSSLDLIHLSVLALPLVSETTVSSFVTTRNGWIAQTS